MRQHAAIGHEFARALQFLPPATLDVIRHHHERWDGAGYPARLRGDAIPLVARIFAVCDVYNALTSERPYKRAWSDAHARAEIAAGTGTQFDPSVVSAFLEIVDNERSG